MLHKKPNSVVTLAILLALFGVSKPARAFLIAQSDTAPTTFPVPDELNEEAKIQIAASDSSSSINQSLTQNFIAKYPQAQVNIETQASDLALESLSAGKVDLVAIGRSLTAQEKAQGFMAVPVSREKIAIVVSNQNSYNGNLTIDQFAQIFRGEISDWSELGGAPGKIKLVDLPDSNDTRQAFPNYQVFQSGEFSTGSNTVKLEQDNTDAMITRLGDNGVGYAVANDVIDRDDVRILSMHQTQPDNQKYPFSQPFSLVYQGTPSEAVQAYLGFATAEGGEQVIVNRVGSLAAAENVAVANGLADNSERDDSRITALQTNPDVADSGEINPDVADSGEINSDVADSGESLSSNSLEVDQEANPAAKIASSQVTTPNAVDGETTPAAKIASSQVTTPNAVDRKTTLEAESAIGQAATPNAVDQEATPEAESAETRSRWWWWLPLIIGVPLLAAIAASISSRKRSDREPAIDNIPDGDSPNGGTGGSLTPDGNDLSTVGANVSGLGNVANNNNSVSKASGINNAAIATGGAALAGGAATNFVGGRTKTEGDRDLDINLEETDPVTEIPSNPVSEFTGQETTLQLTDQPTQLQTDADDEAGGATVASELFSIRETSTDEMTSNPVVENDNIADFPTDIDDFPPQTNSQTIDLADQNLSEIESDAVNEAEQVPETNIVREFRGDFVLDEETTRTPSVESEINTFTGIDVTPETVSDDIDSTSPELDLDLFDDEDTATEADFGSNIGDRTIQTESTAALGGAAVSGFFNRGQDTEQSDDFSEVDEINTSLETTRNEFSDHVIADADIEAISGSQDDSTLEEITFDDADNATDFGLDETVVDAETSSTSDFDLEQFTFDEQDNATDFDLNEITLDELETSSTNNYIDDLNTTTQDQDIDLDDLGFDESESADSLSFDLLSNSTAEITSLSDDKSNDMNNISEWLDSLETPNQNQTTDNISEWLDTLNTDNLDSVLEDSNQERASESSEEGDDISFQFLEDLLERDSNSNRDEP